MRPVTLPELRKLIINDKIEEALQILINFCQSKNLTKYTKQLMLLNLHIKQSEKLVSLGYEGSQNLTNAITRVASGLFDMIDDLSNQFDENIIVEIGYEDSLKEEQAKDHLEDITDELAQEIAFNHFTVSFGDSMRENIEECANEVFAEDYGQKYIQSGDQRRRNIILVGAGATHQSCPYIPFGIRLKEYLECSTKKDDIQIVEESKIKKRRGYIYDEKFDPERYLGLIHDNLPSESQHKLRSFLHEIYNRRYMPTHVYEIIAHMFKHSFTPVIINFNFDELLDEAIEEEMGNQKYFKILHDGDIPNFEELFVDGRLKIPIYIKIHGTASQKSSLRFSENQNLSLSEDIKNFIDQLLGGQIINTNFSEPEKIPVNLISIGFDMERFGFNEQISVSNLPEGSKWFQINWDKKMPDIEIENSTGNYILKSKHIKLSEWGNSNKNIPPLADFLIDLFNNKITKLFNSTYSPKRINRHLIIPNLFYLSFNHGIHDDYRDSEKTKEIYGRLIDYFTSSKYFFERTVIETALLIIKNKGIIEPRESAREKVGFFYEKYKDRFVRENDEFTKARTKENYKPKQMLYESQLFSLNQVYDIFGMTNTYSFSNNLINLAPFDVDNDRWNETDQVGILDKLSSKDENLTKEDLNLPDNLPILVFYRLLKNMSEMTVLKNLRKQCVSNKSRFNWHEDVIQYARSIYSGYTYDIRPVFRDKTLMHHNSIKRKHILHTNLALSYHFAEYFNKPDQWDICLFISERGKLFTNHIPHTDQLLDRYLSDKLIVSISCQEAVAKLLNYGYQINSSKEILEIIKQAKTAFGYDQTNINYLLLPYWRHHHHMVIFLKTDTKPPQEINKAYIELSKNKYLHILRSIYYFKQGFSNSINPVIFPVIGNDQNDLNFIEKDQEFLLNTFFAHYLKAIIYKNSGRFIPVIKQDLSFELTTNDSVQETSTDNNTILSYENFLNCLFKKDLSSFAFPGSY